MLIAAGIDACSDGSAGSGATLLQRAQQDQQDGAQLDLERRPHLAKRRFVRGMARRVLGCGDAGLIAFDDLQQRHHTFVEVRVLGQQPPDLAIAQLRDIRQGRRAVVGGGRSAADQRQLRRPRLGPPRLTQRNHDLVHRRLSFTSFQHGSSQCQVPGRGGG